MNRVSTFTKEPKKPKPVLQARREPIPQPYYTGTLLPSLRNMIVFKPLNKSVCYSTPKGLAQYMSAFPDCIFC